MKNTCHPLSEICCWSDETFENDFCDLKNDGGGDDEKKILKYGLESYGEYRHHVWMIDGVSGGPPVNRNSLERRKNEINEINEYY